MSRVLWVCVILLLWTNVSRASPQLSDGFAPVSGADLDIRQPFVPAPSSTPLTSSRDAPVDMAFERARYRKARRMHRVGVIMTVVGGITVIPLSAMASGGVFARTGSAAAVLGLLSVASGGSYFIGGIVSSVASFTAVRVVNRVFGLGVSSQFAIGGMVASSVGWLAIPLVIGGFAPIIGVICAAVQFRHIDRALDSAGISQLHLSPTPNGLALSLRF